MKSWKLLSITWAILLFGCETPSSNPGDEISSIENGLTKAIIVKGDDIPTFSIEERMEHHKVPGISIAVVRNGKVQWAKGYGIANTESGSPVDLNTLFQAGSISKPVAALGALKLYQEGLVDLDTDVNTYLNDWKVEENDFTVNEKVTLRRLLTHTAGTTVHGFPGYQQTDTFPTITQVLDGLGNTPRIFVDTIPGSIWRYSGGGYTIMEKVVEDVSGQPLEQYLRENILDPLGMSNSTYDQPLTPQYHANASAAYNSDGELIEGLWNNYPEQAAAGLWTTPTDLAKYCIAIQNILKGEPGPLNKETVEAMLTKHKNDWGLGPSLEWSGDSLRFQHGGKNAGFTNNMVAFAYSGDAVIMMTNADNGGLLMREIMRSISGYYDLGIMEARVVEIKKLANEELDRYAGKYIYEDQVPGIGDYIVEIVRQDDKLFVIDDNNGQRDLMAALETDKFINLDDGDEMIFTEGDSPGFRWNNRFQFYRMD